MSGKKGRSGRPRGSRRWTPIAYAGHHLNVLMELWLACQPGERRTVPPKVKRALAVRAIDHLATIFLDFKKPDIDAVIAWTRRRAPDITRRRHVSPMTYRERVWQQAVDDDASAWRKGK